MNEETKRCPYCSEEILATAIKCKHCGSMLTYADTPTEKITSDTKVKLALAGKYEIIRQIGKGGMATVYEAIQKNLNRKVALKVIHLNLIHDEEFLTRFHREAQLAASLDHPNIVTVYDEGQVIDIHYMSMQYLEGKDLHTIIKEKGKLTVEETVRYITPIAEALDYAHGRGVIHRDIKNSNIIVTKEGRPVLTDFGIAHAATGTKLTQTGVIIGTPEYMSPEQANGKEVDHRSDLYSLGVVMYECLTGDVPYKGDNPVTTIYKILADVPEPVLNVNPEVSKEISSIITKAISKQPDERYQTGAQMFGSLIPNSYASTIATSFNRIPIGNTLKIDSGLLKENDRKKKKQEQKSPTKKKKTKSNLFLWLSAISILIISSFIVLFYFNIKKTDTNQIASTKGENKGLETSPQIQNNQRLHIVKVIDKIPAKTHTYLQVIENKEDFWIAVPTIEIEIEIGESVYFSRFMVMEDFKSENIHKSFDQILFVEDACKSFIPYETKKIHSGVLPSEKQGIKIEPLSDVKTVQQIFSEKSSLNGKAVIVKGKVIKFTKQIMKKNWIHIQDGTGGENEFDLVITSDQEVQVGDIIIAEGKVAVDKDFGWGYFFPVLIEDAKVDKE